MRVLHLGKYFPPVAGGMETFCGDLQHAFSGTTVDSHMLVHSRPKEPQPHVPGVTFVPSWGELFFTPVAPCYRRALAAQIQRVAPQVLHFHLPNPAAFWALGVAAARALPWVIHWQSDVLPSPHQWRLRLGYPVYSRLERQLLDRTRVVVATSPDYAAASPMLHDRTNVQVIPLGIDPARLEARAQPPQWPTKGLRIVAVGRLTYYKGFDVLLNALAKVDDASLLLLGDGTEGPDLQRLAAQLGISDRVRFVRNADDAERNAALAAADCLCLPSIERTEAFGLVLVEAMAMGLPVIATQIAGSGVPWVVNQGGHGILAEPENATSLARSIERFASEPGLRTQLQANALANFDRFHIRRVAAALEVLYESLLD